MTALDASARALAGITIIRSQGSFGKGVAGMKDMDNLRLARGVHAIDANSAPLHNKETLTGFSFAEKGFPFVKADDP